MTPKQNRILITVYLFCLACMGVTAWCWFFPRQPPVNSTRFVTGIAFLYVAALIGFVATLVQRYWQRRQMRA